MRFLQAAAEQGHVLAQNNLGAQYYNKRSFKEAAFWFHAAAKQGFAPAQTAIGWQLAVGTGVDKDLRQGIRWLEAAAEQGDEEAMRNLEMFGVDPRSSPSMF